MFRLPVLRIGAGQRGKGRFCVRDLRAGKEKVAPTVRNLLPYISCITNSTGAEYEYACAMRGPDFEDILQYVNATVSGCDILITCNKHDFPKIADPDNVLGTPGPEIITPAEFISEYL